MFDVSDGFAPDVDGPQWSPGAPASADPHDEFSIDTSAWLDDLEPVSSAVPPTPGDSWLQDLQSAASSVPFALPAADPGNGLDHAPEAVQSQAFLDVPVSAATAGNPDYAWLVQGALSAEAQISAVNSLPEDWEVVGAG